MVAMIHAVDEIGNVERTIVIENQSCDVLHRVGLQTMYLKCKA